MCAFRLPYKDMVSDTSEQHWLSFSWEKELKQKWFKESWNTIQIPAYYFVGGIKVAVSNDIWSSYLHLNFFFSIDGVPHFGFKIMRAIWKKRWLHFTCCSWDADIFFKRSTQTTTTVKYMFRIFDWKINNFNFFMPRKSRKLLKYLPEKYGQMQ